MPRPYATPPPGASQCPHLAEAAARHLMLNSRQVLAEPHLIGGAVRVTAARRTEVTVADDAARFVQPEHGRDIQMVAEPPEHPGGFLELRRGREACAHARVLDAD